MKKLICIIYVAVLIVMGAATFIEASEGTPHVHRAIYGTWWFAALWAALALAGAIYIIRYIKSSPRSGGLSGAALLLHVSFLVILAGALLTHLTGRSGSIYLRMGERQRVAQIEHNGETYYHRLNFEAELTDFQIIHDDAGIPTDFRSVFRIHPLATADTSSQRPVLGDSFAELPSDTLSVSMNSIATYGHLRFYQSGYDPDLRGSTLMINRDPWGIPVTYCGYALLFMSFIWLVIRGNRHSRSSRQSREFSRIFESSREFSKGKNITLLVLLLTGAWCVYYFVLDGSWAQIPVLRHPLLIFHVVIIILAYALLLVQTVRSAAGVIKTFKALNNLKALNTTNTPSAPGVSLLRWALCLLAIGIFLGAIWANISWGNYWTWDSKETWALITLMVYAVPLHRRSLPVMRRPRVFHAYMLAAFLTVLMTYFGVNYLLTGMHSYN